VHREFVQASMQINNSLDYCLYPGEHSDTHYPNYRNLYYELALHEIQFKGEESRQVKQLGWHVMQEFVVGSKFEVSGQVLTHYFDSMSKRLFLK